MTFHRRVPLVRAGTLVRRELRSVGTWALACMCLAYALWSTWPGSRAVSGGEGNGLLDLGPLPASSWVGVLVMILTLLLPLWIIERVPQDQKARWFEPLFVLGWSREVYLVSVFFIVVGLGTACLLSSVLLAAAFSISSGGSMPVDTAATVVAGVPTFLASAAGGLLLATVFRDRALALSVALLATAVPFVVSAFYVFNFDRIPPEPLRTLMSIHLPPIRQDASAPWLLYKLAYASLAVWLSLVFAGRRIGRRA